YVPLAHELDAEGLAHWHAGKSRSVEEARRPQDVSEPTLPAVREHSNCAPGRRERPRVDGREIAVPRNAPRVSVRAHRMGVVHFRLRLDHLTGSLEAGSKTLALLH